MQVGRRDRPSRSGHNRVGQLEPAPDGILAGGVSAQVELAGAAVCVAALQRVPRRAEVTTLRSRDIIIYQIRVHFINQIALILPADAGDGSSGGSACGVP